MITIHDKIVAFVSWKTNLDKIEAIIRIVVINVFIIFVKKTI